MAAPTAVILPASRVNEYPPSNQRKCIEAQLTVDGTVGALPGDIPASLFGLVFIEQNSNLTMSDNSHVANAAPAYNGGSLLGVAQSTGVVANIPAGTYFIVLEGY